MFNHLMPTYSSFCHSIGHTPLIKLRALSEATGSQILGKAEFLNPGGSVKDRAALGLIDDAEFHKRLKPGGTIVEGTAGNTGIGLTLVGNAKGYRTVIVIPDNQAIEKIQTLRAMGADVRTVPEAPYSSPENYNHVAKRLAEEIPGAWWANQFDNVANRLAHYHTTGPEIWKQTEGKITGFSASVGTGGTLAGTALALKERKPSVQVICPDPFGAAMWSWFKLGHPNVNDGDSFAEGIGQGRVTKNLENIPVDDSIRVPDALALRLLYHLLRHEGLFLSLSSAINVAGAVALALKNGPGQTIVTILCDSGSRYLSKLYSPAWLDSHGFANALSPESLSADSLIKEIRALAD